MMDSSVFLSQPVSIIGSIRAGKPVPMTDVESKQQLKDCQDFLAVLADSSQSKPYNMETVYVVQPILLYLRALKARWRI